MCISVVTERWAGRRLRVGPGWLNRRAADQGLMAATLVFETSLGAPRALTLLFVGD